MTFPDAPDAARVAADILDKAWEAYEGYQSPLGIGFQIRGNPNRFGCAPKTNFDGRQAPSFGPNPGAPWNASGLYGPGRGPYGRECPISTVKCLADDCLEHRSGWGAGAGSDHYWLDPCAMYDFQNSSFGPRLRPAVDRRGLAHGRRVLARARRGRGALAPPCEHLRAFSDVRVPGLPFALQVPQRQGVGGDDTGCAVWRGATVLARRLLTTACEGAGTTADPSPSSSAAAGAIAAAVASYLGCDAWGTDMPDIAKDAAGACRDHAATARRPPARALRAAPLAWGAADAAAFAREHLPPGRADLVLGSEVV
ncbi:alpha-glucuronidase [Aureococcus anophagefferens]|nr:alpha-glucuronidase [Aureococcus anophagefferens]